MISVLQLKPDISLGTHIYSNYTSCDNIAQYSNYEKLHISISLLIFPIWVFGSVWFIKY